MKRRAFFSAFGIGSALTAVRVVKGEPLPKRDLDWARQKTREGHRVRLESWRIPIHDRPLKDTGMASVTFQMGTSEGVASIDDLALTAEMMEGPWEIVPPEDMPKPPPPPQDYLTFTAGTGAGGDVTIRSGMGGMGGSIYL